MMVLPVGDPRVAVHVISLSVSRELHHLTPSSAVDMHPQAAYCSVTELGVFLLEILYFCFPEIVMVLKTHRNLVS